ncbi:MAG: response regulator [Planctomycetaceae bacterium]|nr:response regulator [Planctomycetaceae bacterium]
MNLPESGGWKPKPTTPRRILVVDDNRGAAQVLSVLLQKFWGHTVETAYDGKTALETAARMRPEIILLDIGLPGLDGFEVAAALRAAPATRGALIAALTGYSREQDRRRCGEVGIDLHLVKPAAAATLEQLFAHPRLTGDSPRE